MEGNEPIVNLSEEQFNAFCIKLISDNTGINIDVNYNDDPGVEFLNPDINNKKRERNKANANTFQLLK